MIIFLNGAFGVGKTTVAQLLVKHIPNSLLFDPEEVGFFLRKIVNEIDNPYDFQDLQMWRQLTYIVANLLKQTYGRTLIIPMCIWKKQYYNEICEELNKLDSILYNFCLTISEKELQKRLDKRDELPRVINWCLKQSPHCLKAFQSSHFGHKINTNSLAPDMVMKRILLIINQGS